MERMQETAARTNDGRRRGRLWRFLPLAVIAAGLAIAYLAGWQRYFTLTFLAESHDGLQAFVGAHPVSAPLGFALVYALAVAFSFPAASVLTIFAGFLFGWVMGGILVAIAATLGATIVFLAARTAFGDFLTDRVSGRAARMARGFEENAFGYLFVLRLAPIFPFWVINIAPALFDVRLRTYVLATLLGILPGTFAYAYLGEGVDSVLTAAARAGRSASLTDLVTPEITLAFLALAVVAAIPLVVKKTGLLRRG